MAFNKDSMVHSGWKIPPTYRKCPQCLNEYSVEDLCFKDDPEGLICNGCTRQGDVIIKGSAWTAKVDWERIAKDAMREALYSKLVAAGVVLFTIVYMILFHRV